MAWERVKREWGRDGVSSLVTGLITIFSCFIFLAILYGAMVVPTTGEILIEREFVRSLFMDFLFIALLIVVLGILGGVELGRYVQMEIVKRKPHLLEPRK